MKEIVRILELKVKRFVFYAPPDNYYGGNPDFTIGIGGRTLTIRGQFWSKDLERIRHILEGYAFTYEATFRFGKPDGRRYRLFVWSVLPTRRASALSINVRLLPSHFSNS